MKKRKKIKKIKAIHFKYVPKALLELQYLNALSKIQELTEKLAEQQKGDE